MVPKYRLSEIKKNVLENISVLKHMKTKQNNVNLHLKPYVCMSDIPKYVVIHTITCFLLTYDFVNINAF